MTNTFKIETLPTSAYPYLAQITTASGEVYSFGGLLGRDEDQIDAHDVELVTSYMRDTLHQTVTAETFADVLFDAQSHWDVMYSDLADYLYEREEDT